MARIFDGAWRDETAAEIAARSTIAATPEALAAHVVTKQQALFNAGLTVDVGAVSIFASTDGQSLGILRKGVDNAKADPAYTTDWITASGATSLDAGQILKIDAALDAFFQALATIAGRILADIKLGKTTTIAQIDAYAWPVGG